MKLVCCRTCLNLCCSLVLIFAVCWISVSAVPRHSKTTPPLLSLRVRIIAGEITDDGSESVKVTMKISIEIKNERSKPALILEREP